MSDFDEGIRRLLPENAESFDDFYRGAPPPWDIGEPQPSFAALAARGGLHGRVLDVGCGTGEHTLLAAGLGLEATGVDAAQLAIDAARDKARQRGLDARFVLGDVLELPTLVEGVFDTVIDSAVFHVFSDEARPRYVEALAAVTAPGSRYYMLVFSERMPGTEGPRRVTQDEIRASFAQGWTVESVELVDLASTLMPVPAWFATITRR